MTVKISRTLQDRIAELEASADCCIYVVAVLNASTLCLCVPRGSEGRPTRNPMTSFSPERLTAQVDTWSDAREPFTFMLADDPRCQLVWIPEAQAHALQ